MKKRIEFSRRLLAKTILLIMAVSIVAGVASCAKPHNNPSEAPSVGTTPGATGSNNTYPSEQISDYRYPENPAQELRDALFSDAKERGLPLTISEVERIEFERKECAQITIGFGEGSENLCVISFTTKYLDYGYDEPYGGESNPTFTLAFKDPDNAEDMVTILTSVIKHLSPDLSLDEAARLANNQDRTLGADGYAQPKDIGGYQVQARYTNPMVFANTPAFESTLGVNVRALREVWRGAFNTGRCVELKTDADYGYLTAQYNSWDEGNHPDTVYADFIIVDVSEHQSYLHGETWRKVDIESMNGQRYSISLDAWAFPNPYEFGVGQRYTLFIGLNYISGVSGGIMYAIQKTESTEFNSRGFQELDGFTYGYDTNWWRVEPEGEGTVYKVYFCLQSQTWGETFAALEGHGLGEAQWPGSPPGWEGYTFVGWYDNTEWTGEPYTKDTPIYKDTALHARWKYTGSGGAWPRAYHGDVQGIGDGNNLTAGQKLWITAAGYNMNLESPGDQRFRWQPMTWRLSDGTSGSFTEASPYKAEIATGSGEQTLFITYREEIFDNTHWQETGQTREVAEKSFMVK